MLYNKSILLIAPCFHDYHDRIVQALEVRGASVVFFPERDYSIWFKLVNNLANRWLDALQAAHYQNILKKIAGRRFDYLFVVRGYKITPEFISGFRDLNPGATTLMYQWDSNKTNPYAAVLPFFDRAYSFDFHDCDELGLQYVPLFYTDDIIRMRESFPQQCPYDFFFMGTYIPERYKALVQFKEYLNNLKNFTLKSYIYVPWTRLLKLRLKGIRLDPSIVTTRHLPRTEYLDMLSQSKVVVDVSNRFQTGLAMRVIEALAMHKKILTDNPHITREPFFQSGNICLFDAAHPSFPPEWVDRPFNRSVALLSIGEWIDRIWTDRTHFATGLHSPNPHEGQAVGVL